MPRTCPVRRRRRSATPCGGIAQRPATRCDDTRRSPAPSVVELTAPLADLRHRRHRAALRGRQRRRAPDRRHRRGRRSAPRCWRAWSPPSTIRAAASSRAAPRRRLHRLSALRRSPSQRRLRRLVRCCGCRADIPRHRRGDCPRRRRLAACSTAATQLSAFAGRFLLGANYWSRAGGPRMWERFDADVVRAELRAAARHRARLLPHVRLRADVHAAPAGASSESARARFRASLRLADEEGVGGSCRRRWSGTCRARTSDFPGQAGALALLATGAARVAAALVDAVVGDAGATRRRCSAGCCRTRCRCGPAPAPRRRRARVVRSALCAAVRAPIRARPDRHRRRRDGRLADARAGAAGRLVGAAHLLRRRRSAAPGAATPIFALRALAPLGRPLLLEEFGCSSTQAGELEQAAY